MAASCLFAVAVIAVLTTNCICDQYGHKLYIIAPVSNRHQNGGKIYWKLLPIQKWNRIENRRRREDDYEVDTVNRNKHEDFLSDKFVPTKDWKGVGRRWHLETERILPRTWWDERYSPNESANEHKDVSSKLNPHHKNIKNDYIQWIKMRQNKMLYEGYRSINKDNYKNRYKEMQLFSDESTIEGGNRNQEQNVFVWGNNLADETDGSTFKKHDGFFDDAVWQQQHDRDEHILGEVSRRKRSPKLTRSKIIKRKRRKQKRKEIRLQRKRMKIIKHDPEDEKFVPSVEDKRPAITYDYSTHEERQKNNMDEEFISKMPRRGGELGEFGEGSDEDSDEKENKAKEVTEDDGKMRKGKKSDVGKPKRGGGKPKKDGDKQKGKRGGDKGKAKKGVGKPKKIGKRERERAKRKGKKRKVAGRDTQAKLMLSDRNLQHHYQLMNYRQRSSRNQPRDFVRGRNTIHNTVFDHIQRTVGGHHPQRSLQNQVGNKDVSNSGTSIRQTVRNKEDAEIHERQKVLEDFRQIFGEKNTVKLLMDKHKSLTNENTHAALLRLDHSNVVNKLRTIN